MLLNSVTKLIFICIQCIFVVAGSISEDIIDTGCRNDTDCKEFQKLNEVANATCFNHHCICRDSNFKTIQCLPQKSGLSNVIGGKCPCSSIKWSTCVNGYCMCKTDFTSSVDKRSCIPQRASIGSSCENNAQCSKENTFATCTNNTCSCQSDFILHNGTCQSLLDLGKECESNDNCSRTNVICLSKQCFCQPGFVAKFDKTSCLPNADYNDGCLESVQCQHKLGLGAVCEQGKCVCGEDYSTVSLKVANDTNTMCEKKIALGQLCTYDTDCFQSRFNGTEQPMYCFLKECRCAQGYELDSQHRFCIQSKNTELQSTWLDSLMSKLSSVFVSNSGNQNKSLHYLLATVCVASILLNV